MGKQLRSVLAANLQAAMDRAELTQEAVEARSGVSQSTISRILLQQTPVNLDTLADLAKGVGPVIGAITPVILGQ